MDIKKVLWAGFKTLAYLEGPQIWSGDLSQLALAKGEIGSFTSSTHSIAHSVGNPMPTIRVGFFTASIVNCRLLGLDPHTALNHDAISTFMRSEQNITGQNYDHYLDDFKNAAQPLSQNLNNDMRSTLEQLTIPHHPYLGIIPWPSFRSRAIIASSLKPPLIDKNELCLDLLSDGICCHSIRGISLHGRGEGTPWDSRSWEAKPWFLQKWPFLVAGHDVQQSSKWWRSRS
ncbi:hypothetical protein BDV26DRAFT_275693 [Aspergillus bertholletiae]|uniref:Uncharacterized protein n=1 Tax=Aspergillus bertholletiae TaxID=1226010 RepID=A0A5N7AP65_9EURO|nr:hypothetical protein BDV26DRAFT_275693 [Aspergillus bertholletiae]